MTKNRTPNKNHINLPNDCCQTVFKKGDTYITAHLYESNGGFWKMFKECKRIGTFDKTLEIKIGD